MYIQQSQGFIGKMQQAKNQKQNLLNTKEIVLDAPYMQVIKGYIQQILEKLNRGREKVKQK